MSRYLVRVVTVDADGNRDVEVVDCVNRQDAFDQVSHRFVDYEARGLVDGGCSIYERIEEFEFNRLAGRSGV